MHPCVDIAAGSVQRSALSAHVMDKRTTATFICRKNDFLAAAIKQTHGRRTEFRAEHGLGTAL
jgi:hypothetical protein